MQAKKFDKCSFNFISDVIGIGNGLTENYMYLLHFFLILGGISCMYYIFVLCIPFSVWTHIDINIVVFVFV